jgi:DnaJ family protein C protein 28
MTPKDWESAIDKQIREAMERGDFQDLPGKGKPLDLGNNPYVKDKEMAYKILKDAGYAPEWIELDKAIRYRSAQARDVLARRWAWHRARMGELAGRSDSWAVKERQRSLTSWQEAIAEFKEAVAGINRDIAELNLQVPAPHLQRFKIDAAAEVEALERGKA